jgi:hypothetical protein
MDEPTVQELIGLRQAHPGEHLMIILKSRKFNVMLVEEAAKEIGVTHKTILNWAKTGLLEGATVQDNPIYIPKELVAKLKEINQEPNVHETCRLLQTYRVAASQWADNKWLRYRLLPSGRRRYSRSDVAFWQDQMSTPDRREDALIILSAPVTVIDELMTRGTDDQLSEPAQQLAKRVPANVLETVLAFRRQLLADEESSGAH